MPRACPVEAHDLRYTPAKKSGLDATALRRGGSGSQLCSLEREAPRDEPVASTISIFDVSIAANVKYHGASPWHTDYET